MPLATKRNAINNSNHTHGTHAPVEEPSTASIADMAIYLRLRLHLGTYRTLHFREFLFARVFVTSAIGGARTQHGFSDSRNRSSRHLAKFFLGSTD